MDRRTFLKSTTAAAAISAGAAAPVGASATPATIASDPQKLAAARHRWRIAPPPSPILRDAAIALATRLDVASAGQIAFDWIEPTDGIEPQTGPDRLTGDRFDAAFGLAPDLLAAPHLALFTALPGGFGLPPEHLLAWHTIAGGTDLLDDAAARLDAKVLIAGHSGPAPGLWATADVTDLRTFGEASIAATGLAAPLAAHIRATFAAAPDRDTVRLVEHPADPIAALAEARADGHGIWFRDGLHDQGTAWTLVLTRTAWNELDESLQAVVGATTIAQAHATLAATSYHRRVVLPTLIKAGALTVRPLPDLVRTAIGHAAARVVADHVGTIAELDLARAAYDAFRREMVGDGQPFRSVAPPIG